MNAMTNALKEAGVKTPTVMYRIWHWLKDHPEKTAQEITTALGSRYLLGTQLTDMYRRGMVTVFKDKSRHTGLNGGTIWVYRYSVVNPREYELLPVPKKAKRASDLKPHTAKPKEEPKVIQLSDAPSAKSAPRKQELTEAEEFAAYLEFKAMKKAMGK